MANLTSVGITNGVPNSGSGTVSTIDALMADGGQATIGAKADAKNTATDATPVSMMQVLKQMSANLQSIDVDEQLVVCTTSVTRPADTNVYTANDAFADSTVAPTAGGFTLTNAGGVSGGSGLITDLYVQSTNNPGTLLNAELHIFDSAPTAINDNAAWNLSAADGLKRVAVIPFRLVADANCSYQHVQGLNLGFTCVGTANLRFLIKVLNAYVPANAETLTFRLKCQRAN
jgi:hypothetical protein